MSGLEKILPHGRRWLVTGAAGFIGSHIVETLLAHDQIVTGLDDFSSGSRSEIERLSANAAFTFVEGSVTDVSALSGLFQNVDYVLHQAALASVPESIIDPLRYHHCNVTGFLNVLEASREAGVKRVVYASSSAVYGDSDAALKRPGEEGLVLSPYALNKAMDEEYAQLYSQLYGLSTVGLRYFNIFGPRQNPAGPYAAVIPTWIIAMLRGEDVFINGNPSITRDFCYVGDVVRANVRAAIGPQATSGLAFNVAGGLEMTLSGLFTAIQGAVGAAGAPYPRSYVLRDPRPGDIRSSAADLELTRELLEFEPSALFQDALVETARWYHRQVYTDGAAAWRIKPGPRPRSALQSPG